MTGSKMRSGILAMVATLLLAAAPARALDILVADDYYSDAAGESLAFLEDVLAGHRVTWLPNTDDLNRPVLTNDLRTLNRYDVVIFYKSGIDHAGRSLTEAEYNALLDYVEAGGNLIVTGPTVLWSPLGLDPLAADLIGTKMINSTVRADYWVAVDQAFFPVDGRFGNVRGEQINMAVATEHDALAADTDAGVVPVGYINDTGYAKVLFSALTSPGGVIVAWTGNWFCDDWHPDVADGELGLIVLRNLLVDKDNDGVLDGIDNCPGTFNPDQRDRDKDGVGDACDNCPTVYNPSQADSNGNGIGDACEGSDGGNNVNIRCGAGAAQALLPIMLGLGLMKVGVIRRRRR